MGPAIKVSDTKPQPPQGKKMSDTKPPIQQVNKAQDAKSSKVPMEVEEEENIYLFAIHEILERHPNTLPTSYPVQVSRHVFMGSQNNADDEAGLRHLGITHVLNCAGTRTFDLTRSPYSKASTVEKYLMIPSLDDDEYDIRQDFPKAFRFLDDCRRSGGKAFVHCIYGVNRSAAICAGYIMNDERLTLLQAVERLKSRRHVCLTNVSFRRLLCRYAKGQNLLDSVLPQWVRQVKDAAKKLADKEKAKKDEAREIVINGIRESSNYTRSYSLRLSHSAPNSPCPTPTSSLTWTNGRTSPSMESEASYSTTTAHDRSYCSSPNPDRYEKRRTLSPTQEIIKYMSNPTPDTRNGYRFTGSPAVSERSYSPDPTIIRVTPVRAYQSSYRNMDENVPPYSGSLQGSSSYRRQLYSDESSYTGSLPSSLRRSRKLSTMAAAYENYRQATSKAVPMAPRVSSIFPANSGPKRQPLRQLEPEDDYISPYNWIPDDFFEGSHVPFSKVSRARRKASEIAAKSTYG